VGLGERRATEEPLADRARCRDSPERRLTSARRSAGLARASHAGRSLSRAFHTPGHLPLKVAVTHVGALGPSLTSYRKHVILCVSGRRCGNSSEMWPILASNPMIRLARPRPRDDSPWR
jgi:hypothetical protein